MARRKRAWRWLGAELIIAIHDEQIAEHGGRPGLRDAGLLESALARPVNIAAHEPDAGVCRLAAAYAWGICRNHPFIDGNKRTALVAMEVFLLDHGMALTAGDAEVVLAFLALASGEMSEVKLAEWIDAHSERV